MEAISLNLFDSGIKNGSTLIADEFSIASFVALLHCIEISVIFETFNGVSFASSNDESFSIR